MVAMNEQLSKPAFRSKWEGSRVLKKGEYKSKIFP